MNDPLALCATVRTGWQEYHHAPKLYLRAKLRTLWTAITINLILFGSDREKTDPLDDHGDPFCGAFWPQIEIFLVGCDGTPSP